MRREQLTRLNKAILVAAVGALLVGCGGSSSNDRAPDTTTQPQFDDGLFAQEVDVSTAAAFADTAEALFLDTGAFAGFFGELDEAIFQVGTLGLGGRTETLLSVATAASGDDGSRRAQREARGNPSLRAFASVSPSSGESGKESYTDDCDAGGTFTEDFWFEATEGDTSLKDVGGFTWTFANCAGTVAGDRFVLNGTWTETYAYDDRWTPENGSGSGRWSDTFETEIDLRGSRNGTPDVLVLDGAVTGEETGDYEWVGAEYSEKGVFELNVQRMEARLAKQAGNPLYIGQLEGSLVEEFEYHATSEQDWSESGATRVSGRIATSGMNGAATIKTPKVVRYADSSAMNGSACPDSGIVTISGRDNNQVEIRFGEDTGIPGVVVQAVGSGGAYSNYLNCNDVDYLAPLFFGPFLFAYEEAGSR